MKISGNKNVIVFVMDFFAADYFDSMGVYDNNEAVLRNQERDREYLNILKDFTYYNNYDGVYYATFPSMVHMFTGEEVDFKKPIKEWTYDAWHSDMAKDFYSYLHNNNYKVNFFTADEKHFVANNDLDMLNDKINNIASEERTFTTDYKSLFSVMVKTSAFRMSPYFAKRRLYVKYGDYTGIVYSEMSSAHKNFQFKEMMKREGKLTVDDSANYFIVQHLNGIHSYEIDKYGDYQVDGSLTGRGDTARGVIYILGCYLDMLKEAGKYDDATIIVTADHGDIYEPHTIFFIKKPYASNEELQFNSAPVSHCELLPTLMMLVDSNLYEKYGLKTIYDYKEGEIRERKHYAHIFDENYPVVPSYTHDKDGLKNIYYVWSYDNTGDRVDLEEHMLEGPDEIIPLIECFQ